MIICIEGVPDAGHNFSDWLVFDTMGLRKFAERVGVDSFNRRRVS
jgi:hypothetical protein